MAKVSSKNTLKNKVIINIGSNGRKKRVKRGSNRVLNQRNLPTPPAPPIVYNTVNPSSLFNDPFGIRAQIATQQLQANNQLKINSDLVKSLQMDLSSVKDVRNEPLRRNLFMSPDASPLPKVNETFVNLPPVDEYSSSASSSSTSAAGPILQTPVEATFIKTSQGSIKVINPSTGRPVAYGGATYKKLVKDGLIDHSYPPEDIFDKDED